MGESCNYIHTLVQPVHQQYLHRKQAKTGGYEDNSNDNSYLSNPNILARITVFPFAVSISELMLFNFVGPATFTAVGPG